jgi:hypothetical protein
MTDEVAMRVLYLAALVVVGAAVAGCGTVRENQYNETPVNQRVSYRYDRDVEVVHVRPAYYVVPAPAYEAVPVTRYYYVE